MTCVSSSLALARLLRWHQSRVRSKVAVSQPSFLNTAFTGYPVGADEINALISSIEIFCEMSKSDNDFLHAALALQYLEGLYLR